MNNYPRWTSTALQLVNNNSYVSGGNPSLLNSMTQFTLEAWVFPQSATGFQSVLSKADPVLKTGYQLYLMNGYPVAFIGIAPYVIMAPQPISLNKWHHLAATYDGSTLILYVDGNVAAQQTFGGSLPSPTTADLLIGAVQQNNSHTWFLHGAVSQSMIWNSVRSPEEILNDSVQFTTNLDGAAQPTLQFYVDFSGLPTADQSGNNITLQFAGDASYALTMPGLQLLGNAYAVASPWPGYNFDGSSSFTLEGWFMPTGNNTNSILLSYGDGSNWQYQVAYLNNNQIVGRYNGANGEVVSRTQVTPGEYYHFSFCYNNMDKTISLYINGNLQATQYFTATPPSIANGSLTMGASLGAGNTPGNFFQGFIQNINVWSSCHSQALVLQWMFNQVVTDATLISAFDFAVAPPVDTTDQSAVSLLNGANINVQLDTITPSSLKGQLGLLFSMNASYLNNNVEEPLPPPDEAPPTVAAQPELMSDAHKEAIWNDLYERHLTEGDDEKRAAFKARFEEAFASAQTMLQNNPKLAATSRVDDTHGMTRLIYHGPKGDEVFFEAPTASVTDCQLWWIQFVFKITVGFLQALGLVPSMGNIASRVYNLVISNARVAAALTSLIGRVITASAAFGVLYVMYQEGVLWAVIKFALTSAGWYALLRILVKIIAILTGLEAAELLAGFIVWAAQLTQLALNYSTACPPAPKAQTVKA